MKLKTSRPAWKDYEPGFTYSPVKGGLQLDVDGGSFAKSGGHVQTLKPNPYLIVPVLLSQSYTPRVDRLKNKTPPNTHTKQEHQNQR